LNPAESFNPFEIDSWVLCEAIPVSGSMRTGWPRHHVAAVVAELAPPDAEAPLCSCPKGAVVASQCRRWR
jgi:hypothetical protein